MKYSLLLVLLLPVLVSAQSISVFNATSVADTIEQSSAKIKSFKGNFIYKKDNRTFYGIMIYVSPNKLVMQFGTENNPQDKKIVSDGRFIWVQEGDIIARQKLEEETNPVNAWNIRKLRRQYIATAPNTGLEIKYGNLAAYQIVFEPKVNTTSFRRINIIASKDGRIYRVQGTSRLGVVTELSISYKEINKEYDDDEFVVNTTEESQIYDNIFE